MHTLIICLVFFFFLTQITPTRFLYKNKKKKKFNKKVSFQDKHIMSSVVDLGWEWKNSGIKSKIWNKFKKSGFTSYIFSKKIKEFPVFSKTPELVL